MEISDTQFLGPESTSTQRDLAKWEIGRTRHWRVCLRLTQRTLGSCYLIPIREVKVFTELTSRELVDLRRAVVAFEQTAEQLFRPKTFNYLISGQHDKGILHLHALPRYDSARPFGGRIWIDDRWPDFLTFPKVGEEESDNLSHLRDKMREEAVDFRRVLRSE